ncbi:tetratricopeptide repeat-containing sensor histidine kinase [Mongoliibacter ruber]|uniref:histidine kinase n=1 Tax=Mongoliibacter ruber TaxID=1750599 RepID=A0A2T0WVM5_9BACT|nr:tetratricopeptide repeat-containing sensor histidine kinase [Mongoliibacter ruber]PRY90753.1 signal transduction histidine kinase [Mongoliibacter ruber]
MVFLNRLGAIKRVIIFFLVFFVSHGLVAQQDEFDSLDNLLQNEIDEKGKLQVLNKLVFLLRERDIPRALELGNEAESLAIVLKDSVQLAKAKGNLGWIHYRLGIWDKAFRYSRDAYLIGLDQSDKAEIAMTLNNLGAIYYQQRNYEEAIRKFKEAYKIGKDLEDSYITIRSLNNIALNYSKTDLLDSAMYFAQEAIRENEKSGSIYFTSFTNRVIGDVYLAQGEIEKAISTYASALSAASHQRLSSFESSILHRLGKAYFMNKNSKKAVELLERGKKLALENGFQDELANTLKNLALVYEDLGDVDNAYLNLRAFTDLSETLNEKADLDRLALIQGMFEVEKSDAEVKVLRSENLLQDLRLRNFRLFIFVITLAVLLLGGLLIRLFVLNKKSKEINKDLVSKQDKVNQQKQVLEKQSKELEKSNNLKNKLFSILGHDLKSPVSQLQSVLGLVNAQELTPEEFATISLILKRNVDSLYVVLDNILSWSKSQMEGFKVQLSPIHLDTVLKPCLDLLQNQADAKELTISTHLETKEKVWADPDLLQVIVRNILSNAIKFSRKGSKIEIRSYAENKTVTLEIQDYGMGMPPKILKSFQNEAFSIVQSSPGTEKEKGTGLGLSISREFMALMDGELTFESEKGKGTKVKIQLKIVQVFTGSKVPAVASEQS